MEVVNASVVAKPFREQVARRLAELKEQHQGKEQPRLVGLLGNDDEGARTYAEFTQKACLKDGIAFDIVHCERHELEEKLEQVNADPTVHGVIIYYPVFGNLPSFFGTTMDDFLRDQVHYTKDVEGLSHFYRHRLYHNQRFVDAEKKHQCLLPCTPLAVVKCLEHLKLYNDALPRGDRLRGKVITVINRSEVVGRPLAAMLANDGATVYSVDIDSIYLFQRGHLRLTDTTVEQACQGSDAIVLGVPSPAYKLPISHVTDDTIIINVASHKNVDKDALASSGKRVTFVPSVGKVTVAMLERNTLRLFFNYHAQDSRRATSQPADVAETAPTAATAPTLEDTSYSTPFSATTAATPFSSTTSATNRIT